VLLDEVRRDGFLDLLRQPTRPGLAQIALMLGYSEQAALSRSCQRWFGSSPSAMLKRGAPAGTRPGWEVSGPGALDPAEMTPIVGAHSAHERPVAG